MHNQQKKKPLPKPTKWRKAFNHIKWRGKKIAFHVLLVLVFFLPLLHAFLPSLINNWMVERNPIKVMAEITYIYDTRGHGGYGFRTPYRVYQYKFRYRDKIYHDFTSIGTTKDYYGDIGDTLVIRCNKDNPNFSRYHCDDNQDLEIYIDEVSGKRLEKEIPKRDGIHLKRFREIINDFKKGKEERERQANASAEHKQD